MLRRPNTNYPVDTRIILSYFISLTTTGLARIISILSVQYLCTVCAILVQQLHSNCTATAQKKRRRYLVVNFISNSGD